MKVTKNKLSEKELAILIFIGTMIVGAWLRIIPASSISFPVNDGGMFFTMIHDLQNNGFVLPADTTYNNISIPFAYPPFSFYLAGLVNLYLHIDLLKFLIWFPAIINILTIPAFLLLSNTILKSDIQASIATFFYTLTPLSMDWFLMGGGLTRSLGQLLLILVCFCYFLLFQKHSIVILISAIMLSALLILTHPESAILAVCSGALIWLFSSRTKSTVLDAGFIILGTILIISPWLFVVLPRTGLITFINAFQTNGSSLFLWRTLITFDFAQEKGLTFLSVIGLVGVFYLLHQKKYLLPVWLAVPFFINPRSAARLAIIPLALIASIITIEIIFPAIRSKKDLGKKFGQIPFFLFLIYISGYMLITSYTLVYDMSREVVTNNEIESFKWIQRNTGENSKFIILTGKPNLMRDPVQEWFPALTNRNSLTTMQGREWTWGPKFMDSLIDYQGLLNCINQNADCIGVQSSKLGLGFNYLYISKLLPEFCSPGMFCPSTSGLINDLKISRQYSSVYENQSVIIFQINK